MDVRTGPATAGKGLGNFWSIPPAPSSRRPEGVSAAPSPPRQPSPPSASSGRRRASKPHRRPRKPGTRGAERPSPSSSSSSTSKSTRKKRHRRATHQDCERATREIYKVLVKGTRETVDQLWNEFGMAPTFSITHSPLVNPYLSTFSDELISVCDRVVAGHHARERTLLKNKTLVTRWHSRIVRWLRVNYVATARPPRANSLSLGSQLVLAHLMLRLVDVPFVPSPDHLIEYIQTHDLDSLEEHYPTLKTFYAAVRVFSSLSACNRWRCRFGEQHGHPETYVDPRWTKPKDADPDRSMEEEEGEAESEAENGEEKKQEHTHTNLHAGTHFDAHMRTWMGHFAYISKVARQLLCQFTSPLQFGDVWVSEAMALKRTLDAHSHQSARNLVLQHHKTTAGPSGASAVGGSDDPLLDPVEEERKAREALMNRRRNLSWMTRSAKVVGRDGEDLEAKDQVELSPEEDHDRGIALRNGPSIENKKHALLSTFTRVMYWSTVNHDALATRTCVAVDPSLLDDAVKRIRLVLDQTLLIEPSSDTGVDLTKMINATLMPVCVREAFLQANRMLSAKTHAQTIMNQSLSAKYIQESQAGYMGKKLKDMYAEPDNPYQDMLDLCIWGSHFSHHTNIKWFERYCLYGSHFQDRIAGTFEHALPTKDWKIQKPRSPVVAHVAGTWCVLIDTHTALLCRSTLEACTLWLMTMWALYDSMTDMDKTVEKGLIWSMEHDADAVRFKWIHEDRRKQWARALAPPFEGSSWTRPPAPWDVQLDAPPPAEPGAKDPDEMRVVAH